jgi:hypothetical protein
MTRWCQPFCTPKRNGKLFSTPVELNSRWQQTEREDKGEVLLRSPAQSSEDGAPPTRPAAGEKWVSGAQFPCQDRLGQRLVLLGPTRVGRQGRRGVWEGAIERSPANCMGKKKKKKERQHKKVQDLRNRREGHAQNLHMQALRCLCRRRGFSRTHIHMTRRKQPPPERTRAGTGSLQGKEKMKLGAIGGE